MLHKTYHKIFIFLTATVISLYLLFFVVIHQKAQAGRFTSPVATTRLVDTLDPLLKPHGYMLSLQTAHSNALPESALPETSYIAVDETSGEVILSKNATSEVPIASLTKIMSAMIALDLSSPQETMAITRHASLYPPTKIGVSEGEQLTVDELLQAMLMTSANDAAQAVADGIDAKYNSPVFVWAMNEKAKMLGLAHTHFANPQGFDSTQNYSSAEDLAILSQYALTNYPEIAHIVALDYVHIPQTATHKQYDLYNWNGLLDVYPNISGVKIGNTDAAKYTNVVVSERAGRKILVVLLGADGVLQRDLDGATLLDSAFAKAYALAPVDVSVAMLRAKYSTWKYWN